MFFVCFIAVNVSGYNLQVVTQAWLLSVANSKQRTPLKMTTCSLWRHETFSVSSNGQISMPHAIDLWAIWLADSTMQVEIPQSTWTKSTNRLKWPKECAKKTQRKANNFRSATSNGRKMLELGFGAPQRVVAKLATGSEFRANTSRPAALTGDVRASRMRIWTRQVWPSSRNAMCLQWAVRTTPRMKKSNIKLWVEHSEILKCP